jgi:hypothetical protein
MKVISTIVACLLAVCYASSQNLILNGNFEAGNINFTNDYLYAPTDMYPQGRYCVVANPRTAHGFWAAFGDHTSGTGLMLVANGDANPTNVAWRQTVSVATNSTYLFSAWAASAYHENPSRFYFFINGQQQGSSVALPTTTGLWRNYSLIWNSADTTAATLEIRMLTTEYGGNDFGLDDLSFRSVTVGAAPPLSIRKTGAPPTAVELTWASQLDQLYQLLWGTTPDSSQWFSLGTPVAGNGGTILVVDPIGSNSMRFYKIVPLN